MYSFNFQEITGIDPDEIYKNQTNLKKAYKAYPELDKLVQSGKSNTEIEKIYRDLRKNLLYILKKDVKEAFIFLQIVVYGNSSTDIALAYGDSLDINDSKELRDIVSGFLKYIIACKKDGILLDNL